MFPCSLKREPRLSGTALLNRLGLNSDSESEPVSSTSTSTRTSTSASADVNLHRNTDAGVRQMSAPVPHSHAQTAQIAATSSISPEDFWLSLTSTDTWESTPQNPMPESLALGLPLRRVQANTGDPLPPQNQDQPSPFERLITTYEPILQTLLAFLPTSSIFHLYHTSRYLRNHLQSYPLAWKTLSFRLPQPTNSITPSANSSDTTEWQSKQFALDLVLKRVVVPIALRLTSLDLCNTAISGALLVGSVLEPRKETLRHVSVRGCKNVSLKYHIVPFLHQIKIETSVWRDLRAFALKSLYTYRCRHHRRRPYLPASLARRDSDSEPTHDLIELCHQLGIWTDTAWCPTPGPRCHRRKDYHGNRAAPGTMEVWVPFDRLWRSSNRVGPSDEHSHERSTVGKLWEERECGHDGEALGTKDSAIFAGEGKDVPTHMRRSHRTFVEDIKCDDCAEVILERCETCSIRMHCMGCRKTLCASCAFNRPLKKKKMATAAAVEEGNGTSGSRTRADTPERYWWASGATRSPNIMTDASEDPDSDDEVRVPTRVVNPQHPGPLKINMSWCCLEPLFSGGGGVAFVGPGLGGHGSERIRAVPLQQKPEYLDPDFTNDPVSSQDSNFQKFDDRLSSNVDILPYLQQSTLDLQSKTCPRCLCKSCYSSFKWKVDCRACKRPICKEHDFRALKARKCGFRDLTDEREYVRNPPKRAREDMITENAESWPSGMEIPEFRLLKAGESSVTSEVSTDDERRPRQAEIVDVQEWSDAGSLEGPSTRDPSSTPRATPTPYADRSSSVASRGPGSSDEDGQASAAVLFYPNLDLVERANVVAQSRPALRGRSLSMSEISNNKGKGKAKALVPHAQQVPQLPKEHMLLPCHGRHPVQWQGCGAYFCQGSRSVGDIRQRCFATGKECNECGVFVCQFCMPKAVNCSCSFCDNNYHCPHCFSKQEIQTQCLRESEIRARQVKLEREKAAVEARIKQEREDRDQADLILKYGGEFWGNLTANVEESALVTGGTAIIGESSRTGAALDSDPSDTAIGRGLAGPETSSMTARTLDQLDDESQVQLIADLMQTTTMDVREEIEEDVEQAVPSAAAA